MILLKPFTVKVEKITNTMLFPVTYLFVGDVEVGYITRNLAGIKSGNVSYCFHWKVSVAPNKICGPTIEEVKDKAIERFRDFVNSILE